MANLQGTTVTGDLAVTGAITSQGAVPVGAVLPVVSALTGSHTIPNTGTVDADGWQYCDGAVIPSSQTLSGTTPDLTDGRFLRGFTSSSGCGGAATFTLGLGNLAAHDHGGATTSASTTPGAGGSTTPGATGGCGQTSSSTTPGATGGCGQTTSGCGQTSASTTPGDTGACGMQTSACSATSGAWSGNSGTVSSWHTHTFTTGGQNCQHCHCICDAGTHTHNYCRPNYTGFSLTYPSNGAWYAQTPASTDSRQHCAQHTCCTYSAEVHLHSGTTANPNLNHSHSVPSHTHSLPSHTHCVTAHDHTSAAHTHTTPSHTHTTPSHTHTSAAHTHTTPSHTHTSTAHTHTGAAHTHATTIASAGSGSAVSHIPIYFNVKYLIRVI